MSKMFRKILLVVAAILLVLILIEVGVKIAGVVHNKKPSIDSQTSNKTIPVKTNTKKITKQELNFKISKYVDLITYKKYQEAYDLLDSDYKTYYSPSLQKFMEVNAGRYKNEKVVIIKYFNKVKENQYVCSVIIRDFGNLPEERNADSTGPVDETFTVNILDNDKFTICPKGFIDTKMVGYYTRVGQIGLKVKKIDRFHNKAYIYLEVNNSESVPITLTDPNSSDAVEKVRISSIGGVDGPRSIRVYAENSIIKYELTQPISAGTFSQRLLCFNVIEDQDLTKLTFNNIMVGQEVRTAEIEFE